MYHDFFYGLFMMLFHCCALATMEKFEELSNHVVKLPKKKSYRSMLQQIQLKSILILNEPNKGKYFGRKRPPRGGGD